MVALQAWLQQLLRGVAGKRVMLGQLGYLQGFDAQARVELLPDRLLVLLRDAEQHADRPHRHHSPKVCDEIETTSIDERIQFPGTEFAYQRLHGKHAPGRIPFAARFHIHPDIRVSRLEGGGILLKLPNGEGWRFRSGDDTELAATLIRLLSASETTRLAVGRRGRERVKSLFASQAAPDQMLAIYTEIARAPG